MNLVIRLFFSDTVQDKSGFLCVGIGVKDYKKQLIIEPTKSI
jgi:hypothetical protein